MRTATQTAVDRDICVLSIIFLCWSVGVQSIINKKNFQKAAEMFLTAGDESIKNISLTQILVYSSTLDTDGTRKLTRMQKQVEQDKLQCQQTRCDQM